MKKRLALLLLIVVLPATGCSWSSGFGLLAETPRGVEIDAPQVESDVEAYRFALRYGFEIFRDTRYDVVTKGSIRKAVRDEIARIPQASSELEPYTLEDTRQALLTAGMLDEDVEGMIGQMTNFISASPLVIAPTGRRDTIHSFLKGFFLGMSNAMRNVDALERMTR